jgi:YrbI family 3-deoxy-D-manno-octulosonate 8-phosphate phosphatase
MRTNLKVSLIVFDFDGVLTDNRILVFADGTEGVLCNRADGLGFDLFRHYQIPVIILSTERNKIVAARAAKLQVAFQQGLGDKKAALKEYCTKASIDLQSVLYVGNDINDLAAMQIVGHRACPADAHPKIRAICQIVLQSRGGAGVARELAESVLGLKFEDSGSQPASVKAVT